MIRSTIVSPVVLSLLLGTIAFTSAHAGVPPRPEALDRESRKAVEQAVVYLQDEAADWMRDRKCVACHHGPMMIWPVQEAKTFGYTIDTKVLAELTAWALGDPSKVQEPTPVKPRQTTPKSDAEKAAADDADRANNSLDMAYIAVAGSAIAGPDRTPGNRAALDKLRRFITSKQEADGGWVLQDPRPPIGESREIITLMNALALVSDRGETTGKPELPELSATLSKVRARLEKDQSPVDSTLQSRVLRLLFALRSGDTTEKHRAEIEEILKRRNTDGGWSQIPTMPSDAYATGQVIYVLSLAGLAGDRPEMASARSFLIKTQTDDGSWPMDSRPKANGGKPAKDLRPIVMAATGWATLGLIRSTPKPLPTSVTKTAGR